MMRNIPSDAKHRRSSVWPFCYPRLIMLASICYLVPIHLALARVFHLDPRIFCFTLLGALPYIRWGLQGSLLFTALQIVPSLVWWAINSGFGNVYAQTSMTGTTKFYFSASLATLIGMQLSYTSGPSLKRFVPRPR